MIWVVSYFYDGLPKATKHQDGCRTLALAQRQVETDEYDHDRIKQLSVVEEPRYNRVTGVPIAKDHRCMAQAELETSDELLKI